LGGASGLELVGEDCGAASDFGLSVLGAGGADFCEGAGLELGEGGLEDGDAIGEG